MQAHPILLAILAALFYGISAPFSKLLLTYISPTWMAALLYLGAGFGMLVIRLIRDKASEGARVKRDAQSSGAEPSAHKEAPITRRELPYVAAMIALDIAAPILMMLGLRHTVPATASLLNNFEIAATSAIALLFFHEAVGRRMGLAIALLTLGSAMLTIKDIETLSLSYGALLIVSACICWGLENNCTRMLSLKDPMQIVVIKGIGSGLGALVIAGLSGASFPGLVPILLAMLLGLVAYGLSIYLYILAQRQLGAARTSAYYAFAPFLGAAVSFAVFSQSPGPSFFLALPFMLLGAYLAAVEKHSHLHKHEAAMHEHRHSHEDGHHDHDHVPPFAGEHSHAHVHDETTHKHPHTPDMHHIHPH